MNIMRLFVALIALMLTPSSFASEDIVRVGGSYTVDSIDQAKNGTFKVVFKSEQPTGKFDVLRLESDHVHVAVKVGQKIRLSAEILAQKGSEAEVAQVVVFIEGSAGRVPVWMLSRKASNTDLRASKYLEMHVPSNDFIVM